MAVKEVNINGKVGRVIIVEVGSALTPIVTIPIAIITASYYTRFRTRLYTTSKAVGEGVVVHRRDYVLSRFN